MYNNYQFNQNESLQSTNLYSENYNFKEVKRTKKQKSFGKKILSLILCAVLFGSVAGGSFYGIGKLFNNAESVISSMAANENTASDTVLSATSLSYVSASSTDSQNYSVETVAASGLKCVVAVTNISVTEVRSYFNQFGPRGHQGNNTQTIETSSCGSGVIFCQSNGYLYMLTNYHVVEGATTLSITFADDETYEATLCGYDKDVDIAVVKVAINDLSEYTLSEIAIVEIANSDLLNVGQQVVAIGNALGYGQSVTTGIVSALNRCLDDDTTVSYIQTDAAINPGNSGGALLDMNGNLIGINTVKVSSTEVEGMCYAIPISDILELIENMLV